MDSFNNFIKASTENLPEVIPTTSVEIITDEPIGQECSFDDVQRFYQYAEEIKDQMANDIFKGYKTSLEYTVNKLCRILRNVIKDIHKEEPEEEEATVEVTEESTGSKKNK